MAKNIEPVQPINEIVPLRRAEERDYRGLTSNRFVPVAAKEQSYNRTGIGGRNASSLRLAFESYEQFIEWRTAIRRNRIKREEKAEKKFKVRPTLQGTYDVSPAKPSPDVLKTSSITDMDELERYSSEYTPSSASQTWAEYPAPPVFRAQTQEEYYAEYAAKQSPSEPMVPAVENSEEPPAPTVEEYSTPAVKSFEQYRERAIGLYAAAMGMTRRTASAGLDMAA